MWKRKIIFNLKIIKEANRFFGNLKEEKCNFRFLGEKNKDLNKNLLFFLEGKA